MRNSLKAFVTLLRPHQWLKNVFVFAGVIFSHLWSDFHLLSKALYIAISFCLIASSVYIFNDIFDRHSDTLHPLKKYRPIPANFISIRSATILGVILSLTALVISHSISGTAGKILIYYLLLNIAYTFLLKKILVVDVFAIASGFILRVLAGTSGIGIHPSQWLLLCTLTLTLFFGFTKRYAELRLFKQKNLPLPKILQSYAKIYLDQLIIITAVISIIAYSAYTIIQDQIISPIFNLYLLTIPLAIYGIFRYLYLIQNNEQCGIDLSIDIINDKPLILTILSWLILTIATGVYFK